MSPTLPDLSNPYASPAADDIAEATEAPLAVLPRNAEIWFASILIWCTAGALATAAGYILLAWLGHTYPKLGLQLDRAAELAQFVTGAANAIVIAGLISYGQYHAVIRRDPIWSRSIALLLLIGSLTLAIGSALLFAGAFTMWLFLLFAIIPLFLSHMMFRWYHALATFRRQQKRGLRKLPGTN
jgi:magnesium-transporting ATPase (P-type)